MTLHTSMRWLVAALVFCGLMPAARAQAPRPLPSYKLAIAESGTGNRTYAAPALVAAASPTASPVTTPTLAQTVAQSPAADAARQPAAPGAMQAAAPASTGAVPAVAARAVDAAMPRFDLSVNNAPAAQVFMQLATGTPMNMLVSPDVSGAISITLKDVTLAEALDSLRELYGYEYRITGNRVFIFPNSVQTRMYRINYLPGRRQGASDVRVSSSSITQAGTSTSANGQGQSSSNNNQNQGSGNGGSGGMTSRPDDSSHVRTTSDADFWREVNASLHAMIGNANGRSVVLNPSAGVIVVRASPGELRQIEAYLKAVQISIERQVMIEAKIVEVMLSKDAQTGVNWGAFGRALGSGTAAVGMAAPGTTLGTTGNLSTVDGTAVNPANALLSSSLGRGFYGLAFQSANFAALLNFLQTQGDISVLSSPRIATLNNQKAVLKVGSDELYVTGVTNSTTTSSAGSVSSPTLQLQPFFSGIALDVTPQIDEAGRVMLHVHPSISTVTEKQKIIDLGSQGGSYKLPLAASTINETDSIVRVNDGQIVAIGGLMLQESRDERTGVPGLSDAPVVGGLFRQTGTVTRKRELVILLKPTVIREDGAWPDAQIPAQSSLQSPASR